MDIMNELPPDRFEQVDDLLAFISIYDDDNRTHAYYKLLDQHVDLIRNKICVEAGCGFGLVAERMAKLGAQKVYAVEANTHLYEIAKQRLASFDNIQVVHADIGQFVPSEPIDLLVHEFFGQLLLDEDIFVLDDLKFSPKVILPNRALLKMSILPSSDLLDDVVTPKVLDKLGGVLVSGLFDDSDIVPQKTVLEWQPGRREFRTLVDIKDFQGEILCFGLEVYHENQFICRAGECDNWSLVWTPRTGDRFELEFKPAARGTDVFFNWIT